MEKLIILIKKAFCKAADSDTPFGHRVDLALFGNVMKELDENFSCQKYGEIKLRSLLERFSEGLLLEKDSSTEPPRYFVSLTGEPKTEEWTPPLQEEDFYDFAFIRADKYKELASLAMDEDWSSSRDGVVREFGLLESYIRHTCNRLLYEKKIVYSKDGMYAALNTGLVDSLFRPIYALLVPNHIPGKQKWFLQAFCVEGGDAGKVLVRTFPRMPERASYFSDYSELFYDMRVGPPLVDLEHVVIENAERLPLKFFQRLNFETFACKDCSKMNEAELKAYKAELKTEFEERDLEAYATAKMYIDRAVDEALARVVWNYKTAIPMYYPKQKSMSLLLPLCFSKRTSRPDAALVVQRMEDSGRYQGHTILTLDMAYSNARLLCRPDSDWLTLENNRRER